MKIKYESVTGEVTENSKKLFSKCPLGGQFEFYHRISKGEKEVRTCKMPQNVDNK